jgi:hypothetical protein
LPLSAKFESSIETTGSTNLGLEYKILFVAVGYK